MRVCGRDAVGERALCPLALQPFLDPSGQGVHRQRLTGVQRGRRSLAGHDVGLGLTFVEALDVSWRERGHGPHHGEGIGRLDRSHGHPARAERKSRGGWRS